MPRGGSWALALCVALAACGSERPAPRSSEPAPAGAPRPPGLTSAPTEVPEPDARAQMTPTTAVSAAAEVPAPGEADVADAALVAGEVVDAGPEPTASGSAALRSHAVEDAVAGSAASPEREPSVVTPLPELCRVACENTHRLVLAELPSDTAQAMRDEVARAMTNECPGRCLQRASLESARCIAQAKTALELAACP